MKRLTGYGKISTVKPVADIVAIDEERRATQNKLDSTLLISIAYPGK
jgi:hypothetical protein